MSWPRWASCSALDDTDRMTAGRDVARNSRSRATELVWPREDRQFVNASARSKNGNVTSGCDGLALVVAQIRDRVPSAWTRLGSGANTVGATMRVY